MPCIQFGIGCDKDILNPNISRQEMCLNWLELFLKLFDKDDCQRRPNKVFK